MHKNSNTMALFFRHKITFFSLQYKYDPKSADWSREMRGKRVISGVDLKEYLILFTGRDAPKAQVCMYVQYSGLFSRGVYLANFEIAVICRINFLEINRKPHPRT